MRLPQALRPHKVSSCAVLRPRATRAGLCAQRAQWYGTVADATVGTLGDRL